MGLVILRAPGGGASGSFVPVDGVYGNAGAVVFTATVNGEAGVAVELFADGSITWSNGNGDPATGTIAALTVDRGAKTLSITTTLFELPAVTTLDQTVTGSITATGSIEGDVVQADTVATIGAGQVSIYTGTGSPEGVVAGATGDRYYDKTGAAGVWSWVKATSPTSTTGWVADGATLWPTYARADAMDTPSHLDGTWGDSGFLFYSPTAVPYGIQRSQSAAIANGDGIYFDRDLAAGTYEAVITHSTGADAPLLALMVDGAQQGSSIDEYGAGNVATRSVIPGVVVAGNGTHRIGVKAAGKNASSSGYDIYWSSLSLTRTGP